MTTLRHKIMDMDSDAPTGAGDYAAMWGYGFATAQMRAACLAADQDAVVLALADALQDLLAYAEEAQEALECEYGVCRTIEQMAAEGDLPKEFVQARAVLAEVGGK